MRFHFLLGLSMIFCLSFLAFAQEPGVISVSGQVTSVDSANNTLTIKVMTDNAASGQVFLLNGDTVISKGEEIISLDQIKLADQTTINYSSDTTGKNTATNVVVNP